MDINLARKRLDVAFVLCLLATVSTPLLAPSMRLQFFSAFLVIAFYKKTLVKCLWFALICGLIIDLLSTQPRLGIYALGYSLTTILLYSQRRHFFADSLSTLPLMCVFFSILSTVFMIFLNYFMEFNMTLSWGWILTDLLIMPFADGLFAFICFILPPLLLGKRPKRGRDYFLTR